MPYSIVSVDCRLFSISRFPRKGMTKGEREMHGKAS
jgi:hypothetical protein